MCHSRNLRLRRLENNLYGEKGVSVSESAAAPTSLWGNKLMLKVIGGIQKSTQRGLHAAAHSQLLSHAMKAGERQLKYGDSGQ